MTDYKYSDPAEKLDFYTTQITAIIRNTESILNNARENKAEAIKPPEGEEDVSNVFYFRRDLIVDFDNKAREKTKLPFLTIAETYYEWALGLADLTVANKWNLWNKAVLDHLDDVLYRVSSYEMLFESITQQIIDKAREEKDQDPE